MSHGDFVRPSGQWANEMVPGQADFQRWDVAQSKGINGVSGGTWNPAKPIILGGAGLTLSTSGSQLKGGVTTQTGGRIRMAGSYPSCNARTRKIVAPILQCGVRIDLSQVTGNSQREDDYIVPTLGPVAWGIAIKGAPNFIYIDIPRRYLHSGARLATAALSFVITQRSGAVPASPMQMSFSGISSTGVFTELNPFNWGTWVANTPYTLGAYIQPTTANSTGYYYKCTTAGTSNNGAEPAWTSVVGSTVPDGTVVWTCTGRNGTSPRKGVTPDSYYAGGQPQTLAFDTDGTTNGSFTNILDTTVNRYNIGLANVDPTAVLTGLVLSFDTITSLALE